MRNTRSQFATIRTCAIACGFALVLGGCLSRGPRDFENENDHLRRQVVELKDSVRSLEAERDELAVKLSEAERVRAEAMPADVLEALPRCAGIEIDRYSGLDHADESGQPDRLRIYVRPLDGRRRGIQIVGTITVEATLLSDRLGDEAAAPRRLGTVTLGPAQVREAYRYDFIGLYYSVAVPLDEPAESLSGTLVVRAELLDAITGAVHRAQWTKKLGKPTIRSGSDSSQG
jgi:hypothetical protein